jgi:hypothetical protein
MSIEKAVALATPLFAAGSAWLTGVVAANFPGLPAVAPGDVTALEITGATAAAAAALKWLHGRAAFAKDAANARLALDLAEKHVAAVVAANPAAGPALADIENLLASHDEAIVSRLGAMIKAPPSVTQVVEQILAQAQTGPGAIAPLAADVVPDPAAMPAGFAGQANL